MREEKYLWSGISRAIRHQSFVVVMFLAAGCVSVPPQIAETHAKELEILQSLEESHLSMVDSFIDQKKKNFESFFFNTYGPVYVRNWKKAFEEMKGRPYDPARDFPQLYNDLVAEYQAESAPIEEVRILLRDAISAEYRNALMAHQAVGRWLDSLEELNSSQRDSINALLQNIDPELSLDAIDDAIQEAKDNVEARISDLQG